MTNVPRESQRRKPIDLAQSCPWPAIGNLINPQVSATTKKQLFAEMEAREPLALQRRRP
jgi:hypothetical protein